MHTLSAAVSTNTLPAHPAVNMQVLQYTLPEAHREAASTRRDELELAASAAGPEAAQGEVATEGARGGSAMEQRVSMRFHHAEGECEKPWTELEPEPDCAGGCEAEVLCQLQLRVRLAEEARLRAEQEQAGLQEQLQAQREELATRSAAVVALENIRDKAIGAVDALQAQLRTSECAQDDLAAGLRSANEEAKKMRTCFDVSERDRRLMAESAAALEEAVKEAEEKAKGLKHDLTSAQSRVKALEASKDALQALVVKLSDSEEVLHVAVESLQSKLAVSGKERERLVAARADQVARAKLCLGELCRNTSAAQAIAEQVSEEVKRDADRLIGCEQSLAALRAEEATISAVNAAADETRGRLSAAECWSRELATQLRECAEEFEIVLAGASTETHVLAGQLAAADKRERAQGSELEAALQAHAAAVLAAQKEIWAAEEEQKTFATIGVQLEQTTAVVEAKLHQIASLNEKFARENGDARERLVTLEAALAGSRREVTQLAEELATSQAEAVRLQDRTSASDRVKRTVDVQTVESFRPFPAHAENEQSVPSSPAPDIQDELQARLTEMTERLVVMDRELGAAKCEMRSAKVKLNFSEQERERLEESDTALHRAQREAKALQSKLLAVEQERDRAREEATKQRGNLILGSQEGELQEALRCAREEGEELQRKLDEVEQQWELSMVEARTLRSELQDCEERLAVACAPPPHAQDLDRTKEVPEYIGTAAEDCQRDQSVLAEARDRMAAAERRATAAEAEAAAARELAAVLRGHRAQLAEEPLETSSSHTTAIVRDADEDCAEGRASPSEHSPGDGPSTLVQRNEGLRWIPATTPLQVKAHAWSGATEGSEAGAGSDASPDRELREEQQQTAALRQRIYALERADARRRIRVEAECASLEADVQLVRTSLAGVRTRLEDKLDATTRWLEQRLAAREEEARAMAARMEALRSDREALRGDLRVAVAGREAAEAETLRLCAAVGAENSNDLYRTFQTAVAAAAEARATAEEDLTKACAEYASAADARATAEADLTKARTECAAECRRADAAETSAEAVRCEQDSQAAALAGAEAGRSRAEAGLLEMRARLEEATRACGNLAEQVRALEHRLAAREEVERGLRRRADEALGRAREAQAVTTKLQEELRSCQNAAAELEAWLQESESERVRTEKHAVRDLERCVALAQAAVASRNSSQSPGKSQAASEDVVLRAEERSWDAAFARHTASAAALARRLAATNLLDTSMTSKASSASAATKVSGSGWYGGGVATCFAVEQGTRSRSPTATTTAAGPVPAAAQSRSSHFSNPATGSPGLAVSSDDSMAGRRHAGTASGWPRNPALKGSVYTPVSPECSRALLDSPRKCSRAPLDSPGSAWEPDEWVTADEGIREGVRVDASTSAVTDNSINLSLSRESLGAPREPRGLRAELPRGNSPRRGSAHPRLVIRGTTAVSGGCSGGSGGSTPAAQAVLETQRARGDLSDDCSDAWVISAPPPRSRCLVESRTSVVPAVSRSGAGAARLAGFQRAALAFAATIRAPARESRSISDLDFVQMGSTTPYDLAQESERLSDPPSPWASESHAPSSSQSPVPACRSDLSLSGVAHAPPSPARFARPVAREQQGGRLHLPTVQALHILEDQTHAVGGVMSARSPAVTSQLFANGMSEACRSREEEEERWAKHECPPPLRDASHSKPSQDLPATPARSWAGSSGASSRASSRPQGRGDGDVAVKGVAALPPASTESLASEIQRREGENPRPPPREGAGESCGGKPLFAAQLESDGAGVRLSPRRAGATLETAVIGAAAALRESLVQRWAGQQRLARKLRRAREEQPLLGAPGCPSPAPAWRGGGEGRDACRTHSSSTQAVSDIVVQHF